MTETFILIPGRTSRQGAAMNAGKNSDDYGAEISTLQMNPADMARLGLSDGERAILRTAQGHVAVTVQAVKRADDLPEGLVFLPYGRLSSQIASAETQGTGMPESKGFEVEIIVNDDR
ncbi:MAG TPA: formylmethanofuran dehydrogenase [Chloroflexi bacterium]|nr:formylmethanofuran dehydrogenase [Chloroflexota bacterium]